MAPGAWETIGRSAIGLGVWLGSFALTMLAWALIDRPRPVDPELAGRERTGLTNLAFRRWFFWLISPAERLFLKHGTSPDTVNYIGLGFVFTGSYLIARGSLEVAAFFILLGGGCDILDGRIARKRKLASTRGEFLDSALDRWADIALFLGLLGRLGDQRELALLILLAASGSLIVSYMRAKSDALGIALGTSTGFAQRPERLMLTIVACVFTPIEVGIENALGLPVRYHVFAGVLFFLAGATHLSAFERFRATLKALAPKPGTTSL